MDWVTAKHQKSLFWSEFEILVLEVLDSAIHVVKAVKGNVQLFDPQNSALEIIGHRGFNSEFLQLFDNVPLDESSACSRAFQQRHRVVIPDIIADAHFAPYLSVARTNGFRAVQSTPIFASEGSVIGMLSTHFAEVHHLSVLDEIALDDHAIKISELISALLRRITGNPIPV